MVLALFLMVEIFLKNHSNKRLPFILENHQSKEVDFGIPYSNYRLSIPQTDHWFLR